MKTAVAVGKQVAAHLAKLFPGKDIFFQVDDALIAGIQVRIADSIFDASFQRHLEKIRENYAYEVNR